MAKLGAKLSIREFDWIDSRGKKSQFSLLITSSQGVSSKEMVIIEVKTQSAHIREHREGDFTTCSDEIHKIYFVVLDTLV